MFYSRVNLQTELIRERSRQQRLMNDIYQVLQDAVEKDEEVLSRLRKAEEEPGAPLRLDAGDEARVFTLPEIKQICIRYRLRFLDSKYFNAQYPYEALAEIKNFERKYKTKIEHFKITAPDHLFNLENINADPMLFAQLADGRFYLLHQWGNDLAWYKRYLLWPLQSFKTFFFSLWAFAFLFAFTIPIASINFFGFENLIYLRIWLMVHTFIAIFGIGIWAGLSFDKTFSNLNWDSKYYNY